MESAADPTRVAARSSLIDSLKGCGLSGIRVDKEELRRRISMPQYLRVAIRRAINAKDVDAGVNSADLLASDGVDPPESPLVVFINSRSGGRHGPELKERLQQLMGEEQVSLSKRGLVNEHVLLGTVIGVYEQAGENSIKVPLQLTAYFKICIQKTCQEVGTGCALEVFDLKDIKPNEFVNYGLACLEQLARVGDSRARETREKLRVVVAGGDGTVGWMLGSLGELHKEGRYPVPPVAVIPLGTGNDLSRSFGWGGSFPFAWKSAVKRSLLRASVGHICRMDR
ncbi:hypothetical protein Cgig2_003762 [Carnegiea gigantea]|uniref:DAGKc domain-containing protein n=1 Tax=Carnegiea gigantea TaxID=171969 RepID=A0A9Q1GP80_9CARY|nr:hypothetical protein Cgig2_003762 [Carnegiea gigantea]